MKFYKKDTTLKNHINKIIEECLIAHNYNRQATADALNMSVRTLRSKIAWMPKVRNKYGTVAAEKSAEALRGKAV